MKDTWFQRRNRGIFLTIRDVDCKDFDVDRLVRDLDNLRVTYLQFFASGYVTTHQTALEHLRISPSLGRRDLVGEIIEALHSYGIKAIPAIELGVIPEKAGTSHPDWCACDADGRLQRVGGGNMPLAPSRHT